MAIAVEMFFDHESDWAVRDLWQSLAGVNSSMDEMNYTPHISLAVYDDIDLAALEGILASLSRCLPLSLKLSATGLFPGQEGVLFLAPAPTEQLLDLHREYHSLAGNWAKSLWPHYRSGLWYPHCTLAVGLKDGEVSLALNLVRQDFAGLEIKVQSLAAVLYPAAKVLFKFPVSS